MKTVDNWTSNTSTTTGFNGSGLRKYINQSIRNTN